MAQLKASRRLIGIGGTLSYVRFLNDFAAFPIGSQWNDTITAGFTSDKLFAVQTNTKVIQRCLLMTTDPGDLVLDPTCGSGTTAYVAEQWGRRWITTDVSRVPLALARQRLLTATFPWYQLTDDARGPAGGFVYHRKQNTRGEEVGGIVPHVTLKSIANNEPPAEEVLVDRPEVAGGITRISGPFTVEATIPTPVDVGSPGPAGETATSAGASAESAGGFRERLLEVLRQSPVLRLESNQVVTFRNVRPPARSLALSAEALVDASAPGQAPTLGELVQESIEKSGHALPLTQKPVAFLFGPENGAVSEQAVYEAAREAHAKGYTHLYVIGFAIQPNARRLVDQCADAVGVPATYVQATPDLLMGDLLKNLRSSQIFSVCGLPEVEIKALRPGAKNGSRGKKARAKEASAADGIRYQVTLLGLDVFDPVTMEARHRSGNDVPAWLLDTDYNGLCFHVCQAFFPRTAAWDNLKKALKGDYDESVWEHLSGDTSAPFEAGEHGQVAVKVIDDRGNELLVVKPLAEAGKG
jgi:adenine-specific DNA-methyltransferase